MALAARAGLALLASALCFPACGGHSKRPQPAEEQGGAGSVSASNEAGNGVHEPDGNAAGEGGASSVDLPRGGSPSAGNSMIEDPLGGAANTRGGAASSRDGGMSNQHGGTSNAPLIPSGSRTCVNAGDCLGLACVPAAGLPTLACAALCPKGDECLPEEACISGPELTPICLQRCSSPTECDSLFDCFDPKGHGEFVCFPPAWTGGWTSG